MSSSRCQVPGFRCQVSSCQVFRFQFYFCICKKDCVKFHPQILLQQITINKRSKEINFICISNCLTDILWHGLQNKCMLLQLHKKDVVPSALASKLKTSKQIHRGAGKEAISSKKLRQISIQWILVTQMTHFTMANVFFSIFIWRECNLD